MANSGVSQITIYRFNFRGKTQAAKDIAGRTPSSHFWDLTEPKLIVCEATVLASAFEKKEKEVKRTHSLSKSMDEGPVSIAKKLVFLKIIVKKLKGKERKI